MKTNILYVFGGEKAQGAEIVTTRLIDYNTSRVGAHLFISPGKFADQLVGENKPYPIIREFGLKKLNRSNTKSYRFYLIALRNYLFVSFSVYRYIKRNKIHMVHANTVVPASYLIPAILYCKFFSRSTKFIWSDHDISYFSKADDFLSRLCVRLYHSTLVPSLPVKQKYGLNEKVRVLYNGLDAKLFAPNLFQRSEFRKKLKFEEGAVVVGMPSVVTPRKGQLALIDVFNELSKTFSNIYLLFAGGFEDATPEYGRQVEIAISNNERISHMGYISSIVDFYNGCDIIVSNSNLAGSEPLGTTIYEAMACGKIVIASNTGGTGEIITDKVDGLLFEAESQVDLKQKLEYCFTSYHALEQMRQAAIEKAAGKFNIVLMTENYNNIIENLKR